MNMHVSTPVSQSVSQPVMVRIFLGCGVSAGTPFGQVFERTLGEDSTAVPEQQLDVQLRSGRGSAI